jgi:hypothetical protein
MTVPFIQPEQDDVAKAHRKLEDEFGAFLTANPQEPIAGGQDQTLTPLKPKGNEDLQYGLPRDPVMKYLVAAGHGVAKAFDMTAQTVSEGAAFVDRKTGLGELLAPGYNAQYDAAGGARGMVGGKFDTANNFATKLIGKREDDFLSGFVEGIAQFTTGWFLTGPLKVAGLGKTALAASGAVRGFIVDTTVFDPYEAQLAELMQMGGNKFSILDKLGVDNLGDLLAVDETDANLEARIKRGLAGLLPGVAISLIGRTIKIARLGRKLKVAATETEKASISAAVEEEVKAAADLVDDTKATVEGDVAVKPEGDGTYSVELTDFEKRWQENNVEGKAPKKDGADWEAHQKKVEERKAWHEQNKPRFSSRAEAEMQAHTIRRAEPRVLKPADFEKFQEMKKQLAAATNVDDVVTALEGTHFNFQAMRAGNDMAAVTESLSQVLRESFDAMQKKPGVAGSEMIADALERISGMTRKQAYEYYGTYARNIAEGHMPSDALAAHAVMEDMSKGMMELADLVEARPHDLVLRESARQQLQQYWNHAADVAGMNSQFGRTLRALGEDIRGADELKSPKFRAEGEAPAPKGKGKPVRKPGNGKKPVEPKVKDVGNTAGMSHRDIDAQLRMFKMSGGQPRNVYSIVRGTQALLNGKSANVAFEVFANSLLSGPPTWATVLTSGWSVGMYEPMVKMLAGVVTKNGALAREGVDVLFGNFAFLKENMGTAWMAMKKSQSILNPQPVLKGITGESVAKGVGKLGGSEAAQATARKVVGTGVGETVRMPGRMLTAFDEFTRVTNYRSYIRAKSLRAAREAGAAQGLKGESLTNFVTRRVEDDLRSAFDAETGIALVPEGLKYADVATFSGPLDPKTFGKSLTEFLNKNQTSKFIVPFARASIHLMDYAINKSTPLGYLFKENRRILMAGGEDAAVLMTRQALGTTAIMGFYGMAAGGYVTGRGPSNPSVRKLWQENHQPYSIYMPGAGWISYRRAEPFATLVGVAADFAQLIHEGAFDDANEDPGWVAYAMVAAAAQNLSSKTYMQGLTEFAKVVGDGQPGQVKRWFQNFATSFVAPQLGVRLNPDETVREVRTMLDAYMSKTPGLSQMLPAKYSLYGKPVVRAPIVANRALNPFTWKPYKDDVVADELVALNKTFTVPDTQERFGKIVVDLHGKEWKNKNGGDQTPYERWMDLIAHPQYGEQGLEDQLHALVTSDEWKQADGGVQAIFPGGLRYKLASVTIESAQTVAKWAMLEEYPQLMERYIGLGAARQAAGGGADSGTILGLIQDAGVSVR